MTSSSRAVSLVQAAQLGVGDGLPSSCDMLSARVMVGCRPGKMSSGGPLFACFLIPGLFSYFKAFFWDFLESSWEFLGYS